MKAFGIVIAVAVVMFISLGVVGFGLMGTYNTEATLRNTYQAKVSSNQAEFDNMWKKIQQTAQVADNQKEGFRQIFNDYANSRSGNKNAGSVMNWIKENNPTIDLSIYNKVLNIVTSSRDSWTSRQNELVDISREYNQNLAVFPGNFILPMFGFQHIDPQIITSSRTEKAFVSGKDDDVDLTPKK